MFTTIPQCWECYHYITFDDINFKCEAYPNRIPENVLKNEIKHNKKYKAKQGIIYSSQR
jgi:hypothetical protein